MDVRCTYFNHRRVLLVYGFPNCRNQAAKEINQIIKMFSNHMTSEEFKYEGSDYNYYELFKAKWSQKYNVDMIINRRQHTILIKGQTADVNKLRSRIKAKNISSAQSSKECGICTELIIHNNKTILSLCGHQLHSSCFKEQLLMASSLTPIPDIPVLCIYCREPVTHDDWNKVLNNSEANQLYHAALIKLMTSENKTRFSWCQNPDCNYIYNKLSLSQRNITQRNCPLCNCTYCVKCSKQVVGKFHESRCEMQ